MPTPTNTRKIDVKYLIWDVTLTVRYYPTCAVANVPDAHISREDESISYRIRPRKIVGAEFEALLSLTRESEIADFFGLSVRT